MSENSSNGKNFFKTFIKNIQVVGQASFKYTTNSAGASIAFFFAAFNAATTTTGAAIILPKLIGYPIGSLISLAYFIILSSTKIKAQHPLRRLLLILIFAPFSAYTSFYSIYNAMSEGRLQEQAFKEIVKSHNHLVTEINGYLREIMSKSNNSSERIITQVENIEEEIKKLNKQREETPDGDIKGYLAGEVQKKTNEKDSIAKDPAYKIYIQTQKILNDNKNQLVLFNAKQLYDQKESGEQIFQKDQDLYTNINNSISGLNLEKIKIAKKLKDLGLEDTLKNEDNYVLVPIFLVPLNSISSGSKEARFVWISLILAIGMEIIPILLSGIHIVEKEEKNIEKPENSTSADNETKTTEDISENNNKIDVKSKTVISQISEIITSLILDIKEFRCNIWNACIEVVSVSEFFNSRNHISQRLKKAMEASQLIDTNQKHKFLQEFYNTIDHDLKSINIENCQNQLASKLFVDIMHKKAQWLVREPTWEYDNHKSDNSGSNNQPNQSENTSSFGNNGNAVKKLKKSNRKNNNEKCFDAGQWYFPEEKYQEFLDWWLESHTDNTNNNSPKENVQGNVDIEVSSEN